MALPSTGAISLGAVRTELGASGPISLGQASVRTLATVLSGAISLNILHGKTNGLVSGNRGYAMGGYIEGFDTNEIVGLQFSTETAINPSAVLDLPRQGCAGINSSVTGYAIGGTDSYGGNFDNIDGMVFATEAATAPTAALSSGRYGLAGVNSAFAGYGLFGMGFNSFDGTAIWPMFSDIFTFSTETNATLSTYLPDLFYAPFGFNSSTRGYVMGNYTDGDHINKIVGLTFSSGTSNTLSATMASARYLGASVNSTTRGYGLGGAIYNVIGGSLTAGNEIDGIQFDTEAAINPSAALAVGRWSCIGVNSNTRGYAMGGYTGSVNTAEVDGIQFDTETAINPSAALSTTIGFSAGVQAGQG